MFTLAGCSTLSFSESFTRAEAQPLNPLKQNKIYKSKITGGSLLCWKFSLEISLQILGASLAFMFGGFGSSKGVGLAGEAGAGVLTKTRASSVL